MTEKYKECEKCYYLPFCASNDMYGYDSENPKCPNYKEGKKQEEEIKKNDR